MKRFPVLDRAIRQEIIAARTTSGLTQRELSAKLRRRNNYIQNIESGRQSIGAAELHVIARAAARNSWRVPFAPPRGDHPRHSPIAAENA